jgi:hypothetical protein
VLEVQGEMVRLKVSKRKMGFELGLG